MPHPRRQHSIWTKIKFSQNKKTLENLSIVASFLKPCCLALLARLIICGTLSLVPTQALFLVHLHIVYLMLSKQLLNLLSFANSCSLSDDSYLSITRSPQRWVTRYLPPHFTATPIFTIFLIYVYRLFRIGFFITLHLSRDQTIRNTIPRLCNIFGRRCEERQEPA